MCVCVCVCVCVCLCVFMCVYVCMQSECLTTRVRATCVLSLLRGLESIARLLSYTWGGGHSRFYNEHAKLG